MGLWDNLELYLKLDGNANDRSDNGRHGTPTGIAWGAGKINSCAQFREAGDGITITGWKGVTGTGPKTVSMWVRFPSGLPESGGDDHIVEWGWGGGTGTWFAIRVSRVETGRIGKVQVSFAGNQRVVGNTVITSDTNWHHVVVVVPDAAKPADVKLYLDGAEDTPYTVDGTANLNTSVYNDVIFGFDQYDIDIDEVAIFSSEKSVAEVVSLYNGGDGLRYVFDRGIGTLAGIEDLLQVLSTERNVPIHPKSSSRLRGEGFVSSVETGDSPLAVDRNPAIHPRVSVKQRGTGLIFEPEKE